MIITHIAEGLGNQFFQYAIGRYLAYKNNTELKLDISDCEKSAESNHIYYRLAEFNIQENFAAPEEISQMKIIKPQIEYSEFLPEILDLPDNVYLNGGWGNEKYFKDIRDILLKEFTLKNPLHENSARWKKKILSEKNSVSIHVRLGDYTGVLWRGRNGGAGLLGRKYYIDCLNELKKDFTDIKIFVFSDDVNLTKYMFENIIDTPVEFVEGCETDAEELYLMSICKHNITANSTFSWWAAWLNQNPNKKVFSIINRDDTLYNRIIMPDERDINPNYGFQPFLSIILYVENNLHTIGLVMESIFSQTFKDFELIVIDTSADGSGKICRKFADNENFSILRKNYSVNKFEAWNIGLENARGSYILFLTAKNFLFKHTAAVMAYAILDKIYSSHILHFFDWEKLAPDMLCSIQKVQEIPADNVSIEDKNNFEEKFNLSNILNGGLDGRIFSMTIEDNFADIDRYKKLELDDLQKLKLLAERNFDTDLSRKIFRRNFLLENKISFNDSDLNFFVNAILSAKNIICIKRTFTGGLIFK